MGKKLSAAEFSNAGLDGPVSPSPIRAGGQIRILLQRSNFSFPLCRLSEQQHVISYTFKTKSPYANLPYAYIIMQDSQTEEKRHHSYKSFRFLQNETRFTSRGLFIQIKTENVSHALFKPQKQGKSEDLDY